MLLVFLILFVLHHSVISNNCDLSHEFGEKIHSSDLIIVGRILNIANNDAVVSVIKILKGFDVINEVKKISHNNDYHLIVVRNINLIKDCKISVKSGEDFLFYLKKADQYNFFEVKYGKEFGDGMFEKRINAFINGDASKLIKNDDPCNKLNCKFGAQCKKWPGNPPTAVCYCSTSQCTSELKENQICGSDGKFYESECHMKREECILQKSIIISPNHICGGSFNIGKKDEQHDGISESKSQFCQHLSCPPYAICVTNPYPYCKCPTDKCNPNSPQICGTDEITYTNICELKKVSCKANRYIGQQYIGRCDMCKFIKCEFNGFCEMTEDGMGTVCKCPKPEDVCSDAIQVPVCGSDDVTYKSECHLKIESCKRKTVLTVMHKESCIIKIQKDLCSQIQCNHGAKCIKNADNTVQCSCNHLECDKNWKNRLCGDDGNYYDSECFLRKAACENQRPINSIDFIQCDQNPCLGVKCASPYQYCRVDANGKGICECPKERCPEIVQPVCGNDKVTYESICHLTNRACQMKKQLWAIHNGICTEEPRCKEQDKECSQYQICRSDIKQTTCDCPTCPESGIGEAVCGTDSKTYRSECHLRMHACNNNLNTLQISNIGACDKCQNKLCPFYSICRMNRFGEPQCICPTDCVYVRRPVCGSDDRTYENECFLKVKSCAENKLITVTSEGSCKKCPENCSLGKMCRDGKCVCTDKCSKIHLRVCGSDGKYYNSECELKRQACLDNKTIRVDSSEASCMTRMYFSDEKNKRSCHCNSIGSLNTECDAISTKCICKTGITGQSCDKCIDGYWNMTENGCSACSCNRFGSESMLCHPETGECNCKPLSMGRYCSVCPSGYSLSNKGCTENSNYEKKLDAVELGFVKDSYAKSYWSGNAESYLSINFTFVPYSADGIILYHSDPDRSSDFLSIILKNRFIEYRVDLGSGELFLKSNEQLTLGRSHSVLIERVDINSRLVIDGKDFTEGNNPNLLTNLDAGFTFTIGQVTGIKTSQVNEVTESFVGCLSSLQITAGEQTKYYLMNQQTSWIIESSNVKPNCPHIEFEHNSNIIEDVDKDGDLEKENPKKTDYCELHKPCHNGGICKSRSEAMYDCQCLPGYQGYTCDEMVSPIWKFKDSSFVIFPSESLQLRQKITIEIFFLPTFGKGLLAFISDGHERNPAFISVLLNRNYVEVTCRTPIGVTKLVSTEPVMIGKWNQATIIKAAKYIYLDLNQSPKPIKKRLIPRGFTNVDYHVSRKLTQFRITNQPIFFGGVDINIHNRFANVISLKPNLKGAIQKIIINGENIKFQNSDIIFNNITQWQGSPCGPLHNPCSKTDPEKSYCIPEMNQTICSCNPKEEHLCLRNSMQHDNPTNANVNRKYLGKSASKYTANKQKGDESSNKNNIRIKFKTDSNDGMLILLKKTNSIKNHFLVIALRNSVIEVAINLGGENGIIRITSNKNISDNKWHTVQVIRNNRNVVLLVDNRMFRAKMLTDNSHYSLKTDGWMWIGGTRKPIDGFPWEYNKFFKGCISELYVDEIAYNLVSDAKKNIGPILKC